MKLWNNAGAVETSCNVIVNSKPSVVKDLEDISVSQGSECTFMIVCDGFPNPTVEWMKNGSKLKPDKRYANRVEENTFYLTISDVKAIDDGQYKVVLKNKAGQCESKESSLTVTMGPSIVKNLKNLEITEGSIIELSCDVSGTPRPTAQWFKEDSPIQTNEKIQIINQENKHILKIDNCLENVDSGNYSVQFKNDFGTSETKATVTILIPPKFTQPLEEKTFGYLNKSAELVVKVLAKPAPKIKWFKDNKELIIKDKLKIETKSLELNLTEYKLIIDNILAIDSGKYRCEANNKCANETSETSFEVRGEPVFVRQPMDVKIVEKKPTKLECEVNGIPIPSVEWYKDGNLMQKTDNILIECRNKVVNTLSFKSVSPADAGVYILKAKNDIGEIECKCEVFVDVVPFFIKPLPNNLTVKENEPIKLVCEIGGSPVPDVVWTRRGEDLFTSDELKITKENENTFVLMIDAAKQSDSGVISLLASNRVGKINCKTDLVVQSKLILLI